MDPFEYRLSSRTSAIGIAICLIFITTIIGCSTEVVNMTDDEVEELINKRFEKYVNIVKGDTVKVQRILDGADYDNMSNYANLFVVEYDSVIYIMNDYSSHISQLIKHRNLREEKLKIQAEQKATISSYSSSYNEEEY